MTQAVVARLDETMWSFQRDGIEYRTFIPPSPNRYIDYHLAKYVIHYLSTLENPQFDRGQIKIVNPNLAPQDTLPEIMSRSWQIRDITNAWVIDRQKFPFFLRLPMAPKTLKDLQFTHLDFCVLQVEEAIGTVAKIRRYVGSFFVEAPLDCRSIPRQRPNVSFSSLTERFVNPKEPLFSDPFTELATEALRTDETPFISEKECIGSTCFVLQEGTLKLVPIDVSTSEDRRAALRLYVQFLRRTFEWRVIDRQEDQYAARDGDFRQGLMEYETVFNESSGEERFFGYIKCTYGVDLVEMLANSEISQECKPLYPDHVFKCNTAALYVNMDMVESLFFRLFALLKPALDNVHVVLTLDTTQDFLNLLRDFEFFEKFSLREIRGLYLLFRKFAEENRYPLTARSLLLYLEGFETAFHGKKTDCINWNKETWDKDAQTDVEDFDNFSNFYQIYKKRSVFFNNALLKHLHGLFITFCNTQSEPRPAKTIGYFRHGLL